MARQLQITLPEDTMQLLDQRKELLLEQKEI